jgi:hypothetical protein
VNDLPIALLGNRAGGMRMAAVTTVGLAALSERNRRVIEHEVFLPDECREAFAS